jgi:hypothetical protein
VLNFRYSKLWPILLIGMIYLFGWTAKFVLACCKPQDCNNYQAPVNLCLDNDGDGYGNPYFTIQRCEEDPEIGYVTNCTDNCPQTYNPDQTDVNGNGIGDACEGG